MRRLTACCHANRRERVRCRLGTASRDNASSPPAGCGEGRVAVGAAVASCGMPPAVFHDDRRPMADGWDRGLREGTGRGRGPGEVGTTKCNIRARVELEDAVKPDLCCRLMTGHDLIGQRRHSRVSTVPPERSAAGTVHEQADARSGVLQRGGDLCRCWTGDRDGDRIDDTYPVFCILYLYRAVPNERRCGAARHALRPSARHRIDSQQQRRAISDISGNPWTATRLCARGRCSRRECG